MPTNIEDYIHRIGRTGRAGAMGTSISFFTEKSNRLAGELMDILRQAGQQVPPELESLVASGRSGGYAKPKYSTGSGGGMKRW